MNTHDPYAWWRAALEGDKSLPPDERAQAGYYREGGGGRAIALAPNETGVLTFWASDGFTPKKDWALDHQFRFWEPVSYERFDEFCNTGRWWDAAPEIDDAPLQLPDDMPESEKISKQISHLDARFKFWLKDIGGVVVNEDQDKTASTYAAKVADLAKEAERTHKALKAPILEAGRKIDREWGDLAKEATAIRQAMLKPTTDYRVKRQQEEEARRAADIARQREEQDRIARENEAARQAAEQEGREVAPEETKPIPPVHTGPRARTGLRTVNVVEFTSLRDFAEQIATMNAPPADFIEVCEKIARRMILAGSPVKGARMVEAKKAS